MKDGKMSKSKGNVVYPEMLVERFGLDALRYYLMREVPFGSDGVFTPDNFVARYNYDLVNDLGNLLRRTIAMISKYRGGKIPAFQTNSPLDEELDQFRVSMQEAYHTAMAGNAFSQALEQIFQYVRRMNKYIDETAPWQLAKDEDAQQALDAVLSQLAYALYQIAILLQPFLTEGPAVIMRQLGLSETTYLFSALNDAGVLDGVHVKEGEILYQREDVGAATSYIAEQMQNPSTT